MSRTLKLTSLLIALLMFAAACGQKEGVHQGRSVGFAPGGGGGGGEGEEFVEGDFDEGFGDEDFEAGAEGDASFDDDFGDAGDGGDGGDFAGSGEAGGDAGGGETGGGGDGGGDAGGATEGGGGGETGGGETGGGGGGDGGGGGGGDGGGTQTAAGPNDTVGVTDAEITIGVHAPLSGAAPLPQASFESGKEQYWRHIGKVEGRDVKVIVRDDQYNPSRAQSVCNQLIQQDKVFILVGGGGADQIAACARTAAQQGVPYLSAGVDEGALRQLPNYFALSMSYPQQAPLIAQYIEKNLKPDDGRVAIVRDRTPGFNNVVQAVDGELKKRGMETQVIQFQNGPSTAQAVSQFKTAFVIMAPSQFVQIVRSPGGSNPQWAGVGITMGLNTVANAACAGGTNYKGHFLSPFPGLNAIGSLDGEFSKAGGEDDIQLALWGLNKYIHETLKKLGGNIGRAAFVNALETNEIKTNVYPATKHTKQNHFGASTAHLLVANCSKGQYETPQGGTFVSGF
jgi:branched-chain amino acid transport system substrate-binding protein